MKKNPLDFSLFSWNRSRYRPQQIASRNISSSSCSSSDSVVSAVPARSLRIGEIEEMSCWLDLCELQVHLTQGDYDGKAVIVTWVTPSHAASEVRYGIKKGVYLWKAKGVTTQYTFYNYTSGYIHHVTLSNLQVEWCLHHPQWYIHSLKTYHVLEHQRIFSISAFNLQLCLCRIPSVDSPCRL